MADQDTDRWIFEVLAPDLRRKMKTLKNEIQWTDLVYVATTNRMTSEHESISFTYKSTAPNLYVKPLSAELSVNKLNMHFA